MQVSALFSPAKARPGSGFGFAGRRALGAAAAIVSLTAASACSAESDRHGGEPTRVGAVSWIRVALVTGQDEPVSTITAHARFLRYHGVDAETAEILAGGDPALAALAAGTCRRRVPETELDLALGRISSDARVAHLDGGELRVQAQSAGGAMEPSVLPALAPYVTGVEYDELMIDDVDGVADRAEIAVTGFGGVDLAPFDLVATLPATPAGLEVSGEGGVLRIRWQPDEGGDSIVVVTPARGGAELRCRPAADGAIALYPAALREVAPTGQPLLIAVERLRRSQLRAPGVPGGWLEVAARYVVTASAP